MLSFQQRKLIEPIAIKMQWVNIEEKEVKPSLLEGLPSIIAIGHTKKEQRREPFNLSKPLNYKQGR